MTAEFVADPGEVSLADARAWLREWLDDGCRCPCCEQHAQRYRWTLPASAVRFLLQMYRVGGTTEFVESKALFPMVRAHAVHIPAMWYLIEHERERRPDGGKSGWWRVTELGEAFIKGTATIPKYAYVYANTVLGHDGEPQTISDRLGHPFDWREHLRRLD